MFSSVYRTIMDTQKIYIKHVMENLDEVQKLIRQVQEKLIESNLTAENRYWSVLVACTLTGIILAKRCGLVQYDTKSYLMGIERLKRNKRQVEHEYICRRDTQRLHTRTLE